MPDEPDDLDQFWERALRTLATEDLTAAQRAWLGLLRPLGLFEDTALLAAANEFTRVKLEATLRPVLARVLSAELGREISVALTLDHGSPSGATTDKTAGITTANGTSNPSAGTATGQPMTAADEPADDAGPPQHADPARRQWLTRPIEEEDDTVDDSGSIYSIPSHRSRAAPPARLNAKYTFETFVIGSSNRFSHAAAVAVAEAPAKAYNPLFIYGDSGLGKTHLLHAVGHYAYRMFPHIRVRYVPTEEFTNDFINLVHSGKAEEFRRRYRDVDLLLVDDIQFLEQRERTQEEFFHTFNTLHNASKQIVITCDRSPKQLTTLEDRLRTRFGWGLITDVQAPDLETRIAILRKKASQENLQVPADVLEFIAGKIQTNIRELEGALIRINAFASLNRQTVDLALTEILLRALIPDSDRPELDAATIMAVTAEYFSVTLDDLTGTNRSRTLVNARQMAMYLCRELTDLSLPVIGRHFGGKDHTTVMHATRKITRLMAEKRQIYNQVTELTARIKSRGRQ